LHPCSRDHKRDPIGMELCLRQPMRSSCCQPAWITEKRPIGVELCLRQSMRSYSSQPEISRDPGDSPIGKGALWCTPANKELLQ
jgi:hypothetical protein